MPLIYLAAHLPSLAPSLEDYDSINFALGLRDFDPARHQPHPPGSPVYIALGRIMLPAVRGFLPLSGTYAEALTLAIWSAIAGAIAIMAAGAIFKVIAPDSAGSRAHPWAIALLAVCPLFWMSGLRPMSDLPGLAAALVAQALVLQGRTDRRRLVYGALVCGLAAGIRVQAAFLTLPLLVVACVEQRRAGFGWLVSRPMAAGAAGVIAWAVPLVIDSGGLRAYLRALGSQAGEDFAWVDMLWLDPTPRRLAFALYETFVLPWGSVPLAAVIAAAAAIGGVVMVARERHALSLLLLAFAPYTLFHLLFQETITVRYALPVLPLVAWLAARGLAAAGRLMPILATPLFAGALLVCVPAGVAYGREPHPAFRAIGDASRRFADSRPAAIYAHHSVWRALYAEGAPGAIPEPPRLYEWLGPVGYWKGGGVEPVWFFADSRRTDLALIDPHARRDVVRYTWTVASRPELSGVRPTGTDWYRIGVPGWFAGEGWSLTPETGGLARASAASPDHLPVEAWVRRRPGPLHLVIGGRHLGEPGDPAAQFKLALDGVVRDRWAVSAADRNFLRFLDLPDGIASGEGIWARLTVASAPSDGSGRAPVGIRQFDIQSASRMLYAFGEGWHEEEYDPPTGRTWRWTSGRSILRLKGALGSVRLTIRGESPLRYLDAPPTVRVTAGAHEIAHFRPDADFEWTVIVPAADVAGDGRIAIETAPVYLPGPAEGTSDERHLGLRIYECRVDPVSP